MSEYKKQVAAGALTAVILTIILAWGVSYLFPLQPTPFLTPYTTRASSTTTTVPNAIATTATETGTTSTATFLTETSISGTTETTILPPNSTTVTTFTTSGTSTPTGPTVTVTLTQVLIKGVEVSGVYFNSSIPTHVFVNIDNAGNTEQRVMNIFINGKPLSSVYNGTSKPSLPFTIAAGELQDITLTFSSPLPSGTYFISILTGD